MNPKPKLAMYWAASCGGCEISLVNLNEHILDVEKHFDFMFCPCLLDTKRAEIEALPDKSIAITLFNGAIRTDENLEMAHVLRNKSEILIAYGSCSSSGCIPALANLTSVNAMLDAVFTNNATTRNGGATACPSTSTTVPEGELHLPAFESRVRSLRQVVDVDYFIPGCPPEAPRVWEVIEAVINGSTLPPRGTVLGGGQSTVCDECKKRKENKTIPQLRRHIEFVPDTEACLLEQGILCMGIATRDGCGALCPKVNMPCVGCYGPPEGVPDQGAKMIAALGSILDISGFKAAGEQSIPEHMAALAAQLPDPAGSLYKFSLATSLLEGARR
jgi:F420-non-reducing hydrogenase small subunit